VPLEYQFQIALADDETYESHTDSTILAGQTTTRDLPTLSVVIPTTLESVKTQYPYYAISSFLNGTSVPEEIIVVISGVANRSSEDIINQMQARLNASWGDVVDRIKFITVPDSNYAGKNRNIGARAASSDLISFFDGDDIAHPRRVEILRRMFHADPELEVLLHGFTMFGNLRQFNELIFEAYDDIEWHNIRQWYDYSWDIYRPSYYIFFKVNFIDREWSEDKGMSWCCELVDKLVAAHNGWPTVRKSVFRDLQFDDNMKKYVRLSCDITYQIIGDKILDSLSNLFISAKTRRLLPACS